MKNHFMVDIETTGVNRESDSILEIALVEIKLNDYWELTGREYHQVLYYGGEPRTVFAKENMSELYKKCNNQNQHVNYGYVRNLLRKFVHRECSDIKFSTPKYFMGWNASNFDLPFLFNKGVLIPSFYEKISDTEEVLRGDVHYRIYEQTGAFNLTLNSTGLSSKTIKSLCMDLNPTGLELPQGKSHEALYDCYSQIIMMNGLIKIARDFGRV